VDDTLYATNDANMNVTALVDASSGSVVERYAYDPYGRVRVMDGSWGSRSTSNYDWQVLYAGYQHDSESGLQYARNRYSDDATGDWTTRDSDGYANSFDLYSYVRERPTGNLDPYGSDIFAPAPDGPVVQASVRALKRGNCGNVYFAVSWVFKVAPKQDGWVIQEVTIHRDTKWTDGRVNQLPNNANGDWHYWEAWPVYKGSREAGGRMGMYLDLHPGKNEYNVTIRGTDQFSATSMPQCTKGHESWFGWVDFYPGPLPPGNWVRNNSKTKAGVLPATTSVPGFGHPGTGGGTHLLEVSWDCGSGVKPTRVVDHTP
jgi:RHS repeat-associated protein